MRQASGTVGWKEARRTAEVVVGARKVSVEHVEVAGLRAAGRA